MPTALISVSDKTGIVEFAQELQKNGWTFLASGTTAQHLRDHKISITEISTYTQSPEMLGGRVKTLHPAIHAGILARATAADQKELKARNWQAIDLVVVNLYPFIQTIAKPDITFAQAIEQIDIGGVALIRAAAKNHERVTLICDPKDYEKISQEIQQGEITADTRKKLAIKGFAVTSHYDASIAHFFQDAETTPWQLNLFPIQKLRYGENPHQSATLYNYSPIEGPLGGKLLQGKELSYNNLLDLDAAWKTAVSFSQPTVCIVKHVSPCGIASANQLSKAFELALACDPISAFGGVIACNQPFDEAMANSLGKLFVECIAAPAFTEEAKKILQQKTQCRLLEIPTLALNPIFELRSINHGVLYQTLDQGDPQNTSWKIVTDRKPTDEEWNALHFAWQACQSVKSNAIILAKNTATIGIGGGQPNRIDCVKIALRRAGDDAKGCVMASDAFFPFADCVELAAQAGISAIVHPGGSIRDQESIAAADAAGITMAITGVRHFRH